MCVSFVCVFAFSFRSAFLVFYVSNATFCFNHTQKTKNKKLPARCGHLDSPPLFPPHTRRETHTHASRPSHPLPRVRMLAELVHRLTSLIDRVLPPPSAPPSTAPMEKQVFEASPATPATGSTPARGPELRSIHAKDGPPVLSDGVTTLAQLFARSASKFADNACLGWRPKQVSRGGEREEEGGREGQTRGGAGTRGHVLICRAGARPSLPTKRPSLSLPSA